MNARGVAALRRLTGPPSDQARCQLCGAPLPAQHEHLVEPTSRRIDCACSPCAILFDAGHLDAGHVHAGDVHAGHLHAGRAGPSSGGAPATKITRRRVGTRTKAVRGEAVEQAWDALGLPISLAFVTRWTQPDGTALPLATSPSPLGTVDHAVHEEQLAALREAHPALAQMRDDVEALLVQREPFRAFIVPIDRCFDLAGRVRSAPRQLGSGRQAREVIEAFFDELEARGA